MHEPSLRDLLADLFAAHGYAVSPDAALEGRSGTLYTVPILAEGDDRYVLVDCAEGDDPVDERRLEGLGHILADVGADIAVLVHLEACRLDAPDGVFLWDRTEVARLIGSTLVARSAGLDLVPLPLSEPRVLAESPALDLVAFDALDSLDATHTWTATEQREPAAPRQSPTTGPRAGPTIMPRPPAANSTADSLMGRAAQHTHPATTAAAQAPPAAEPASWPALPLRIPLDEAKRRVRDRVFSAERVDLVLQPVWLIDYDCDLLVEGTLRSEIASGRIEVHGTSRAVREVDQMLEDEALPPLPAGVRINERPLRTSQERALEEARRQVVAQHTRLVAVRTADPDEGFTFTEKKRVEPRPDHVHLVVVGCFHRPYWRLAGVNGTVDVDGVTGEVVAAELRSRTSDAVLLD